MKLCIQNNLPYAAMELPAMTSGLLCFSSIPKVVSSSRTKMEPGTVETKPNLRALPVSSIKSQPEDFAREEAHRALVSKNSLVRMKQMIIVCISITALLHGVRNSLYIWEADRRGELV